MHLRLIANIEIFYFFFFFLYDTKLYYMYVFYFYVYGNDKILFYCFKFIHEYFVTKGQKVIKEIRKMLFNIKYLQGIFER